MFWSRNMGNKKVVKKTNISNTHVPDKVYAYMIQSHHMLYELLNCEKGDSVSVEVFDDVGVEHPDGSRDAIQLKSALSNRNPVSNGKQCIIGCFLQKQENWIRKIQSIYYLLMLIKKELLLINFIQ